MEVTCTIRVSVDSFLALMLLKINGEWGLTGDKKGWLPYAP